MKRILVLFVCLVFLAGCGAPDKESANTPTPTAEIIPVAVEPEPEPSSTSEPYDAIDEQGKPTDRFIGDMKMLLGDETTVERDADAGIVTVSAGQDYSDAEAFMNNLSMATMYVKLDEDIGTLLVVFGENVFWVSLQPNSILPVTNIVLMNNEPRRVELHKAYYDNELIQMMDFNLVNGMAVPEIEPPIIRAVFCDDENVMIRYSGIGKDRAGDDVIEFYVTNKTQNELTFQADSFALDGRDLGYISGSDSIAPNSSGGISFEPEETIPLNPSRITGTIRVLDFDKTLWGKQSYDVKFVDVAISPKSDNDKPAETDSPAPSSDSPRTATLTGTDINLRSGPGTDYDVVAKVSEPSSVTIVGQEGEWYEVEVEGKSGYLRQDFVSLN